MKRLIFAILILTIGFYSAKPAFSAESPSVPELQQQIQNLKAENEALKKENQALRKLAFEKQSPAQATVQPPTASTPAAQKAATTKSTEQKYWITNSSSKRHNSACRYFQNSNGRFCGPNDGIPCKICGG